MSTVYNPTSVAPPAGYTIPSDGDAKTAASVNGPFQALMDNVKYLDQGGVTSSSYEYAANTMPQHTGTSTISLTGTVVQATTGGYALYGFDFPHGATINSATVYIDPAGGHTVFGNIGLPVITVLSKNLTTNADTILGTTGTVDPSGTIGAYEVLHTISKTGIGATVDRSINRYYVRITLETGTDFQAGLVVVGVRCNFTVALRDLAAA